MSLGEQRDHILAQPVYSKLQGAKSVQLFLKILVAMKWFLLLVKKKKSGMCFCF